MDSPSVTSREWVVAFYVILAIAIVAVFGFTPVAALIALALTLLTLLANRACSAPKLTYFVSLRLVASVNPTGETFVGQVFVLPALGFATLLSWLLGLTWLLGAREWPRDRWLRFLRRYRAVAQRLTYRH